MTTGRPGIGHLQELTPIVLPIAAEPESVLVMLLRFSSSVGRRHRWTSRRIGDAHAVLLTLEDGPLAVLRLRFAAYAGEARERPGTAVWVSGQFAARASQLDGVLERWRARREACALRDDVLDALRALTRPTDAALEVSMRASERWHVTAAARLYAGGKVWRAEVVDVSEGGLSMVIATEPAGVESDRQYLLAATSAEVEVLMLHEVNRTEVAVRYAVPDRAGDASAWACQCSHRTQ